VPRRRAIRIILFHNDLPASVRLLRVAREIIITASFMTRVRNIISSGRSRRIPSDENLESLEACPRDVVGPRGWTRPPVKGPGGLAKIVPNGGRCTYNCE